MFLPAFFAVGCGGEVEAPTSNNQDDNDPWTIEDARAFDEFQLYWLGETYGGLPLTKIIRYKYDGGRGGSSENTVTFTYGSCEQPPDGGCAAPLQIEIGPYCDRPPSLLPAVAEFGPDFDIRGALGRPRGFDQTRVWIGDTYLALHGDDTQTAARDLRPLADDGSEELAPLHSPRSEPCSHPPPTPDFSSP